MRLTQIDFKKEYRDIWNSSMSYVVPEFKAEQTYLGYGDSQIEHVYRGIRYNVKEIQYPHGKEYVSINEEDEELFDALANTQEDYKTALEKSRASVLQLTHKVEQMQWASWWRRLFKLW